MRLTGRLYMRPDHRAQLVSFLVSLTRLTRETGWRMRPDSWACLGDGWNTEVGLTWDRELQSYGAAMTCRSVAAADIARLLDGDGD